MRFLICGLMVLLVTACIHNKKNQSSDTRVPASAPRDSHLNPEEVQKLSRVLANKEEKPVHELLRKTAISQSLVSSFDARLEALSSSADADRLLTSNIYCKVLNIRSIQESVNEQAIQIFEFTANRPADRAWLLERMQAFAAESILNETAIIQILRVIRNHEVGVCGAEGCLAKETETLQFRVPPFDDQAFADFVAKNRKEIARYSNPRPWDLNPGSCFNNSRMPNQASTYDWKNRNWVGSVLPEGSFAITYDDGPHADYTRSIRDVWVTAGMAKPAFFWLTQQAKKYPDIVQELSLQGYTIGSHSDGHPDIGSLARSTGVEDMGEANRRFYKKDIPFITNYNVWKTQELDKQIPLALARLENIAGKKIRYFRLPYGSGVKNELVAKYFQKMNVEHFFWRVDSLDWQDTNPVSIRDRVVKQMNNVKKGIILFHDVHPQTIKASELLVQYFKNNPDKRAVTLESIPGLAH